MQFVEILIVYLVIMNSVAFVAYAMDKRKARKGKWRIPEKTLLLLTVLGGSVGALLGMFGLRHKTKHIKFVIGVPVLFAIHVILIVYFVL